MPACDSRRVLRALILSYHPCPVSSVPSRIREIESPSIFGDASLFFTDLRLVSPRARSTANTLHVCLSGV